MRIEVDDRVPANVTGFAFSATEPQETGTALPNALTLSGPNGEKVPVRLMAGTTTPFIIVPDAPLMVGDFTFSYVSAGSPPDSPTGVNCAHRAKYTLPFHVVDAVPLPDTVGTLNVTIAKQPISAAVSTGACFAQIDAATATLDITPSEALKPWLPISRWEVRVDGAIWPNLVVFAGCTPLNDAGESAGLKPGKHTISVTAEIPNAPSPPALTREVDLQCGDSSNNGDGCSSASSSERSFPFVMLLGLGVMGLRRLRNRSSLTSTRGSRRRCWRW